MPVGVKELDNFIGLSEEHCIQNWIQTCRRMESLCRVNLRKRQLLSRTPALEEGC